MKEFGSTTTSIVGDIYHPLRVMLFELLVGWALVFDGFNHYMKVKMGVPPHGVFHK